MTSSWYGTPVVPGVAYGPVVRVISQIAPDAVAAFERRPPKSPTALLADYDEAVAQVAQVLEERAARTTGPAAEVLATTATLARDNGLRAAIRARLDTGESLLAAVASAVEEFVSLFAQLGGAMAERITDLRDLEQRICARIIGGEEPGLVLPDTPSVVVAEDLAPADTVDLDPARVLGLITEKGGPTSHTAIVARQLGLPCVVGATGIMSVAPTTRVLLDGGTGRIEVEPDVEEATRAADDDRAHRQQVASWSGPATTADGVPVTLLANVADGPSARSAASFPVDGVGLFRTELCFLDRESEPDLESQVAIYSEVLTAFGDRTVVIRTLDAGSDKPIPYATVRDEENPALGVRGLRLSFDDPGPLDRQLEAIAVAAARTGAAPRVMAPMVATVSEAAWFADRARTHGLVPGIMVETPSAALLADQILGEVDFVSIGTNDLTQYTMAADRLASDLAHLADPWQPAVLQLVANTARAGERLGKPVGVCGEAAADPLLAAVLVGMGVTSLSMSPAAVSSVGVHLNGVTADHCREAAASALGASSPQQARANARAVFESSLQPARSLPEEISGK